MIAGALVGATSEIPVFLRSKVVTKADVLLAEQVRALSIDIKPTRSFSYWKDDIVLNTDLVVWCI